MVRLIDGSYPPPLDFERASLTWVTKDNSYGRWRVIASCCSSHAGRQEQFVLSPRIMAGDVYGPGKLPLHPSYGFQIIASSDRHVIIRDFDGDLPSRDTSNSTLEIFSQMTIEAPFLMDAARLMGSQPGPDEMMRGWPLTARICVNRRDVAHLIDFPVLHLNAKGDHAFQIETGPVLLPASLFEHKKLGVGGFAIAFAFCNRLDRADLAIWSPISEGSAKRAYVHFARLEEVHIELYSGRNHSG